MFKKMIDKVQRIKTKLRKYQFKQYFLIHNNKELNCIVVINYILLVLLFKLKILQ